MPRALCLAALAAAARAHTAVIFPPPRQAVDRDVAPWTGAIPEPLQQVSAKEGWWCPVANMSASLGQACFWFSNGCAIGCDECDQNTRGPGGKTPICKNNNATATICDPKLRTVNTEVECGSSQDRYYYSPWRAPGSSPILDACGMAGGRTGTGGAHGAVYKETVHAKLGDLGSKLPPMPTGTVWQKGSAVNVSWGITANHGGGYQYRLCPASEPLTEACFQKTPLPFVGQQGFRWGGPGGEELWYDGVYVSEGTMPPGSTWSKNPIPRNDAAGGFEPFCKDVAGCGYPHADTSVETKCRCSGMWGPYDLEIVDTVQLPGDLTPGDYVLGWRNDCEESNQVWASCSDVTVVDHPVPVPPAWRPPAPAPPTPPPMPTCGGEELMNNDGRELPGMPVVAAGACDCNARCATAAGCAAWTYWTGHKPAGNCWLRAEWGRAAPKPPGTPCWSARVTNRTARVYM